MGYPEGVKGYRIWCLESKKVVISRDVTFREESLPGVKGNFDSAASGGEFELEVERNTQEGGAHSHGGSLAEEVKTLEEESSGIQEERRADEETTTTGREDDDDRSYRLARDRERRQIKPPARFGYADLIAYALSVAEEVVSDEPQTFQEAMNSKQSREWILAMEEELASLEKNATWTLVPRPKGVKTVSCKWVYKHKEGIEGVEAARFKSRLVARGFTQREGVDYNEIFSPVVKHSSIRILLAMVVQYDLELEQMDVKTAFLHGQLDETIYMQQPPGYAEPGREDWVCLLKKSLYGLKQSPRQWYKRFDTFMLEQRYQRSSFDSCVYFRRCESGDYVYLLLYVDDMLLISRSMREIRSLKAQLRTVFEMKDLGPAKKILGMEIRRDRASSTLFVSQAEYLKKVLLRFDMTGAKAVSVPLAPHFKLSRDQSPSTTDGRRQMVHVPYASLVGSLMYAMVCTRPDIAHAVSVVSRFMGNPGIEHWKAAKWILRYIAGASSVGLVFKKTKFEEQCVNGYVDSDYAGDLDRRRSLTGYVFTVFGNTVSWKASLQHIVALSTTEAEYIAATEAIKEALWVKGLVNELGVQQEAVDVFCDSQSAICLTKNQMYHERTKHIDIRLHFIRDIIEEGVVRVQKIHTSENPADMITKPVPASKFELCLKILSIAKFPETKDRDYDGTSTRGVDVGRGREASEARMVNPEGVKKLGVKRSD